MSVSQSQQIDSTGLGRYYPREPQTNYMNYYTPSKERPENAQPLRASTDLLLNRKNIFQNENLTVKNVSPYHYQYRRQAYLDDINNNRMQNSPTDYNNNQNPNQNNMERKISNTPNPRRYEYPGPKYKTEGDYGPQNSDLRGNKYIRYNRKYDDEDYAEMRLKTSKYLNINGQKIFDKPFDGIIPHFKRRPFQPKTQRANSHLDPFYKFKNHIFYGDANPEVFGYDKVDDKYRYFSPYRNDYNGSNYGDYIYNYYLNAPMRGDITEDFQYPPQYYWNPRKHL